RPLTRPRPAGRPRDRRRVRRYDRRLSRMAGTPGRRGPSRPGARRVIDPITLEVVREALSSIVREMRVTLVRTAYSSILYEGEDFSCVLMDRHAQIVAMSRGQDHPLHIVPISWSMKAVHERFGDDIHPGDIFLHNDPYTGGRREREGDFRAMIGTCRKAAERVEALLGRYGHATLQACVSELLDRAEQRMRQRIRELPPGQYAYEAYLEGGHDQLEPLRV